MKIVILYVLICFPSFVYAHEESSYDDYAIALKEKINANQLDEALEYVNLLESADSLSEETILDCIFCYESLEKYKECISFCDQWMDEQPNDSNLFFYATKGECYYFLDDVNKACQYIEEYIGEMTERSFDVDNYYYGMYACLLKKKHRYAEAQVLFERYFGKAAEEDGLTRQTLYESPNKEIYGYRLYQYAYNYFFQGNEDKGLTQLCLAKQCGNEAASEDYDRLTNSGMLGPVKFKKGVVKKFEKYIQSLDVYGTLHKSSQEKFWSEIADKNQQCQKLNTALQKSKKPGTLRKALDKIIQGNALLDKKLIDLEPFDTTETEKQIEEIICGTRSFLKELRIYPANEVNAFATPNGQIYLTSGLVMRYHFNNDLLAAVCAHEMAHYVCQHSVIAAWEYEKKEKKNEIWAGIAVGLNTFALGAAAMYGASNGVKYDDSYWNSITDINNSLMEGFRRDTYYFKFKYGRQQEVESDIIAYKFCEAIGLGGYAYIMALQLLNDGDCFMQADKESDHPTVAFRVGLLKHLYSKEHTNEENTIKDTTE